MSASEQEQKPRRPRTKLPVVDVLAAIRQHHGNVSEIASQFGVARSVIYLKMRAHPTLDQAWQDEQLGLVDIAHKNIRELLLAKDWRATMLTLTTLGKKFGWDLSKTSAAFADDDSGQINTVSINAITINSIEHNRFAEDGTQSVSIDALAPPPEPEQDDSDMLTIEGELVEEPDDAAS